MLTTPHTFGEIARVGPIKRQAEKISTMLSDPRRTGYVAVALAEEMPVNETLELGGRLEAAVGLGLDAVIVNGLYPERYTKAEASALRSAAANGLEPDALTAVQAALTQHERSRQQQTHVRRLRKEAGAPVLELPMLFEPEVGLEEYEHLRGGADGRSSSRGVDAPSVLAQLPHPLLPRRHRRVAQLHSRAVVVERALLGGDPGGEAGQRWRAGQRQQLPCRLAARGEGAGDPGGHACPAAA